MIKNIIFDFGGVIYDIDHNLSKLAFEKLGVKNFDQLYGHQIQTEIFENIETGSIEDVEFLNYLRKFLPSNTSLEEIEEAWCALLLGFDRKKIQLIGSLAANYKLFLLSNSNIIHYKRFILELNRETDFRALFNDVWFSHEKGMRKPDKNFYTGLLEKNQLVPQETLFIDDLDKNIEAAAELGIQTYYLEKENILDLFDKGKWLGD